MRPIRALAALAAALAIAHGAAALASPCTQDTKVEQAICHIENAHNDIEPDGFVQAYRILQGNTLPRDETSCARGEALRGLWQLDDAEAQLAACVTVPSARPWQKTLRGWGSPESIGHLATQRNDSAKVVLKYRRGALRRVDVRSGAQTPTVKTVFDADNPEQDTLVLWLPPETWTIDTRWTTGTPTRIVCRVDRGDPTLVANFGAVVVATTPLPDITITLSLPAGEPTTPGKNECVPAAPLALQTTGTAQYLYSRVYQVAAPAGYPLTASTITVPPPPGDPAAINILPQGQDLDAGAQAAAPVVAEDRAALPFDGGSLVPDTGSGGNGANRGIDDARPTFVWADIGGQYAPGSFGAHPGWAMAYGLAFTWEWSGFLLGFHGQLRNVQDALSDGKLGSAIGAHLGVAKRDLGPIRELSFEAFADWAAWFAGDTFDGLRLGVKARQVWLSARPQGPLALGTWLAASYETYPGTTQYVSKLIDLEAGLSIGLEK